MRFDDALAALLGLIGQRVDVAIESRAGGLVAHFTGELARGHDLSPRADELAPIFFSFADGDSGSGFILDPRAFTAAEWSSDGAALRIEDRAGVVIVIDRSVRMTRPSEEVPCGSSKTRSLSSSAPKSEPTPTCST